MLQIRLLNCRVQAAMGADFDGSLAMIQAQEKIGFWQDLEAEYSAKKLQETQAIHRYYDEKFESLSTQYQPDKVGMSHEEKMRMYEIWLQTETQNLNHKRETELKNAEDSANLDIQRCQNNFQEAKRELEMAKERWNPNDRQYS
ncbi:hypothetical protein [Merismopedia glauca]|nr:hypothetical protein [Merismopedia glauca]